MEIHEHPIVDGAVGEITTPIDHRDYKGLARFLEKHIDYARWEAQRYAKLQENPAAWQHFTKRQRFKYRHLAKWWYMRKFAPAFLEAFEFNATDAGDDLKDAITLLRDQNSTGKRKLPDDPPMPFAAKHWPALIVQDGKPQRRVYETAVVSTLRERLRAGDVWVDGSREYRRFDSYLQPRNKAETIMRDAGFETDPEAWLSDRRTKTAKRFDQVERALKRNALSGVRIERGRLKITPHDAVTPPAAVRLERAIDAVMPRIRITELLWEVNAQTGFLDAFTDLRSGKQHDEPAAVLATILAGATNLGLERMAHASSRVSHAQLSGLRLTNWAQ